jgi:hypothetical protein
MATPHVAGTAALCIWRALCTGSPAQIIARLRSDAQARRVGYGYAGDPNAYGRAVLATPGLVSYWRLGERSGTAAADQKGSNTGAYAGGVTLGQPGALTGNPDTAAGFDGVDDDMRAGGSGLALSTSGTLEGWFYWQGGVALMRDATSGGGWILAYDAGGNVAYRVGGTTFVTSRTTASVRNGWHHFALTSSSGTAALYIDGSLVRSGTGAGSTAALMPWRVMHNGVLSQYTSGRADEVAVYNAALSASTISSHYSAGKSAPNGGRYYGFLSYAGGY